MQYFLYCSALNFTVLYCSELPQTLLYVSNCTVQHCIVLHLVLHCAVLNRNVLYVCTYINIAVYILKDKTGERLIDIIIPGMKPCGLNCPTCPYIEPGTVIQSSNSSKKIEINGTFNCKTRNVVYCITCEKCELLYIGQTTRSL